jgi:hypothetical protein
VGNQRIVDHEDNQRAQWDACWQRSNLDFAFDRQGRAHTGAAQREAKDALSFQRFPQ